MFNRKLYRAKKKSLGYCLQCITRKAEPSKSYCSVCLIYMSDRAKARQKLNRQKGLCIRCGKPSNKTSLCSNCLTQDRLTNKLKREQRKQAGLCQRCGDNSIIENTHYWCETCFLKAAAYNNLDSSTRWKEMKHLYDQQNGFCPYTNRKLILGINTEVDHKIPKCKGGTNTIDNLQWIYAPINFMKSGFTHEEFLNLISEIYTNLLG